MNSPRRITTYLDGIVIKHLKNRSVRVMKNNFKGQGVIVEFRRADVPNEEKGKSAINFEVIKGKIELSGVALSDEAAMALYYGLHDYFTRVTLLAKEK